MMNSKTNKTAPVNETPAPVNETPAAVAVPVKLELEGLPAINFERALTSPVLLSMRSSLAEARAAGESDIMKYGELARSAVEDYRRTAALALAALPVNEKGKLDPQKYDGFKTPAEVATELFGFKLKTAYSLLNYGKRLMDDKAPAEYKAMPYSNAAALDGADPAAVRKAFETGELTSKTSQRDLKAFTASHPKTTTKGGEVRVVTRYSVYRGGKMQKAPGGDVTEDDFKASFPESTRLLKFETYAFEPADAPGKRLSCKRYVAVREDLECAVFTLIPAYEKPSDKPKGQAPSQNLEELLVAKYLQANPDSSKEDAVSALQKLGIL